MGEDIRRKLGEQILREFENIESMEDGVEKDKAIDNLIKLLKMQVEEEKMEAEAEDLYRKQDSEEAEKKRRVWNEVTNRIFQLLGIIGPIAGSIILGLIWRQSFREGLFFEENGVTTSTFFKENLKHLPIGRF